MPQKIQKKIKCKIIVKKSNDPRSYRQDSSKLLRLGFKPKYSINDAIDELISLNKRKTIKANMSNYTVKWMKKLKIQ